MHSYMVQQFPLGKRPVSHQKIESWTDKEQTEVETGGKIYEVLAKQRNRSKLTETIGSKIRTAPCDVYNDKGEVYLIPSRRLETMEEEETEEEMTFLESLIQSEPTLEYIFRQMPHREEDHGAIADLMIREQLVAASDGGDDQDGHIVCSIILASEDLLEIHLSSHEVFGEPKDSGRAEMMGVMAIIAYLCQIIKRYDLP